MSQSETAQIYLITPKTTALGFYGQTLKPILDAVDIACLRLGLVSDSEDDIKRHADALREIAFEFDVPVLLTDHYRLVTELGLDGVHRTDGVQNLRDIRKELGADSIIGSFCGASKHQGLNAGEIGVDYVSFGPVSQSNLSDETAAADLFQWWTEMIELPVVAEGALSAERVSELKEFVDFFALGEEIWNDEAPPLAKLTPILNPLN